MKRYRYTEYTFGYVELHTESFNEKVFTNRKDCSALFILALLAELVAYKMHAVTQYMAIYQQTLLWSLQCR